ncbi:MAG: alpha/beta fold hydrolase [Alphaproteobacteria bacterium]
MTRAETSDGLNDRPAHRTIDHGRGRHACLVWDGPSPDAPVLHFAHANGFNGGTYRRLLGPLATQATIYACDMRGHGATDMPADPETHRSWLLHRDDLIALLEVVSREAGGRPLVLAGHSMGATSSVLAALARPDLVRSLVLLDPVMIPRRMIRWYRFLALFGRAPAPPPIAQGAEKRRAVFADREAMVERYHGRGAFTTWPRGVVEDYVVHGTKDRDDGQVELACAPAWEAANFRVAAAHDYWPHLRGLRCPVTLLRGTIASTCAEPQARAFTARVPQTRDRAVDGATHFLPMDHVEEARTALLKALTDDPLERS